MPRIMNLLDPTLDIVFKLMLVREPRLLVHMLEAILGKPIVELTVVNPNIPGNVASSKAIVLDVRAILADGSRADLEMQVRAGPVLRSRLVYYGARDYSDQLVRGDEYDRLTPTTVVVWLVQPLFPTLDRLHSTFELRERHTHMLFSDQLTFHVLQLSALSPTGATGYAGAVERWARFFTARDQAELDRLAAEDPIMHLAKQTLEQLSQDPATRRLARERADALRLYEMDLAASKAEGKAEGRAEGKAEGRAEGKAELLLELVGLRFGPPSEQVRAQVETASAEQLDQWAERVLTARTIDEILAP
jgi:predicted transposase/invertase (TIGR01784 family)